MRVAHFFFHFCSVGFSFVFCTRPFTSLFRSSSSGSNFVCIKRSYFSLWRANCQASNKQKQKKCSGVCCVCVCIDTQYSEQLHPLLELSATEKNEIKEKAYLRTHCPCSGRNVACAKCLLMMFFSLSRSCCARTIYELTPLFNSIDRTYFF